VDGKPGKARRELEHGRGFRQPTGGRRTLAAGRHHSYKADHAVRSYIIVR
jgi:hypothetical protein